MKIKKIIIILITISFLLYFSCKSNENDIMSKNIKIVRVNWTGVTIKSYILNHLLLSLGYNSTISNTSVPIVYKSLSMGDSDVFLGNWMPTQTKITEPYFKSGAVIPYCKNMENAMYTLAVPSFVYEQGLKDFDDIVKYGEKLDWKIYGIEKGNDGNIIISKMIKENLHKLENFSLIESSEAGMLATVKQKIKNKNWIVFLGWSPHQMNMNINMKYLSGSSEATFGKNNGKSTVYTNIRKNFDKEFPNIAILLKNLKFPIKMINEIMHMINDKNFSSEKAGLIYLKENPQIYENWLKNVTDINKMNGRLAFKKYLEQYFDNDF